MSPILSQRSKQSVLCPPFYPEQVEGLLVGKVVAFDINEREYSGFMSVKK